jgi:hypothetical protein
MYIHVLLKYMKLNVYSVLMFCQIFVFMTPYEYGGHMVA